MTNRDGKGFWAKANEFRPSDRKVDFVISFLTAVTVAAAWLSITEGPSWSWPVIIVVDLYLLIVLTVSAYRSYDRRAADNRPWILILFPRRFVGLYVMFGLIAAIVLAFAGLYKDGTCVFGRTVTSWQAIYISFSTLGFNDFQPNGDYGWRVVIVHLASALLLIMGVFA
ncbi:MAG: hypothetical protein ACRDGM_01075, partial [bacterium]